MFFVFLEGLSFSGLARTFKISTKLKHRDRHAAR